MNNFKKIASFLAVLTLVFLSGRAATSVLAQGNNGPDNEVTICHASNSDSNPYITETPNKNGSVDGHDGHNGPVWPNKVDRKWGDIIPPFDYGDNQHYLGKNWPDGQAIWNNGCKIPWGVSITHQEFSCGLSSVTLSGTAQYGGDTSTTLLIKLNGIAVLNSQSELANWSKLVTVVPGQINTVNAYVYDKSNFDSEDTPKATDTWQFTIANCSKKHVCTDSKATNYDSEFNEVTEISDNSVCTYPSTVPSSPTPPTCGSDEHLNLQGDKCLKWELGGPPPPPSAPNSGGAVLGASTVNDPGQVLGAHTLGATGSSYDYVGLSLVAAGVAIAVISGYEIKKTL